MEESLQRIQTNTNIVMDAGKTEKEETVEELIKKLQNRGTKVKILGDNEEVTKPTRKQKSSKKKELVDANDLVDKPDLSNKENAPVGG